MVSVCEVPANAHSDDGDRETTDGDMLQGQSCLSQQPVSTVGALPSSAPRVWEELVGSSLVLMAWDSGHHVADLSKAGCGPGEGSQQGWHKRFFPSRLAAPWQGVPRGNRAAPALRAEQGITSPDVWG